MKTEGYIVNHLSTALVEVTALVMLVLAIHTIIHKGNTP